MTLIMSIKPLKFLGFPLWYASYFAVTNDGTSGEDQSPNVSTNCTEAKMDVDEAAKNGEPEATKEEDKNGHENG